MALSSDPEKRARSLANLRKGPPAAAKNFGLTVVDYDEPEPESAPRSRAPKTAKAAGPAAGPSVPAASASSGPPAWLVVGGGIALLLVLVLVLNHTAPRS